MKSYLAYISVTLKLTWRDKMVIFFNYLFPLIFFFIFAQLNQAEKGGAINAVFSSVLVIGVLGNGFFGGGIRAVVEREQNILRRFKVAPITPAPILVSAIVVGLINYLPSVFITFAIAHFMYGMGVPERWLSAILMAVFGTIAFRAMGQIIASVANSMAESQIIIQSLYFPMLFLSGAAIPMSYLPSWVQILAQFIPSTYLFNGMQNILIRNESLLENIASVFALMVTTALCVFISMKLFRWEKEEKLKPAAKLWILASLLPFFLVGIYQTYSKENLLKARSVTRELLRSQSLLIRDVRVFVGDGTVLNGASVLVQRGKIAEIFTQPVVDAESLHAQLVEASGKTLLPGLVDPQVMLTTPGGVFPSQDDYLRKGLIGRELAAYLFSGVVAVGSAGDSVQLISPDIAKISQGETLGADVYFSGPLFTAKEGAGTEWLGSIPENVRSRIESQLIRIPANPDEARRMVQELKQAGATFIRVALDGGAAGHLLTRLDPSVLQAIGEECRNQQLSLMVATGDAQDVTDAIQAGANVILTGSSRSRIPDETFDLMKSHSVFYVPMLAALEASGGDPSLLERSLVQQIGPPDLLSATKNLLTQRQFPPINLEYSIDNLRRAYSRGVDVAAGSGSGQTMMIHGPGIHREMFLWKQASIPNDAILQAATTTAARLLRIQDRLGLIQKGREASLLLVNGNPFQEIQATEAISSVIFKGEQIGRSRLFDQDKD